MGLPFHGEFTVPASPDAVIDVLADVPRMAQLMPGAFIEGQQPDGAWRGGMLVAFGPKKIRFQGKVTLELDRPARSGRMVGRGSADMRAARVETRVQFDVKDGPGAGSLVQLCADTTMTGVLAEFARTGGAAVAGALMEQFARNLRQEFSASATPASAGSEAPPTALRAETVLWSALRRWLRQLTGRAAS